VSSKLSNMPTMQDVTANFTIPSMPTIPSLSDIKNGFKNEPSQEQVASKSVINSLVETEFRQNWQWAISITDLKGQYIAESIGSGGGESNAKKFMIYAKDVAYGHFSVETDSYTVGAIEISEPIKRNASSVTLTLRDDTKGAMATFFKEWGASVFNDDGTQRLPSEYLRIVNVKHISFDGVESNDVSWAVYPTDVGDVSLAYESAASFSVFTVTLQKIRSMGSFKVK